MIRSGLGTVGRHCAALGLAMALAACGGGGGSGQADAVASAAVPAAVAAASAADASTPVVALVDAVVADAGTPVAALQVPAPNDSAAVALQVLAAVVPALPVDVGLPTVTAQAATTAVTAPGGAFVDADTGNDSNPGTMAAPWKTLAKLASTRVQTGQNVFLSCSSVWRESLLLTASQLPSGAGIYGYGSSCGASKPRILGSDDFSKGWTKVGNVWSRSVPAGTPKVLRMFVDGVAVRVAQWPNYGGVGREYAKVDASATESTTALLVSSADRAALAGQTLTGATLQVRSEPWYVESQVVSGYNATSGALTAASPTAYPMEAGKGYVLTDKLWMLDAPGEFFHDTVANKLYVYPPSTAAQSSLNTAVVEGAVRDVALAIKGISGVSVHGLMVGRARSIGLSIEDSPGAIVSGIEASGNGDTGIRLSLSVPPAANAAGGTVADSVIRDNWSVGIDSWFAAAVTLRRNLVEDTGTLGQSGGSLAALRIGDRGQVLDNRVRRSAYLGIRFSGVGGTVLRGNLISDYCLRLTDCAGIYTWNGATAPVATANMNSLVEQNRLLGSRPNTEGAVGGGFDLVSGIYLDNFARGVVLRSNTVHGAPIGIFIHNSSNNLIEGNGVWLSTVASLVASMDNTTGADWLTGNTISGNTLVPVLTASGTYPALPTLGQAIALKFSNAALGAASLTSASNLYKANTIVALNDTSVVVAMVSGKGITGANLLDAAGWRKLNPLDGAVTAPSKFALYQLNLGAELIQDGAFDRGLQSWSSWFVAGTGAGTVAAGTLAGCTGQCAVMQTSSINDSLMSAPFSMTVGIPYKVTFTASLAADATVATPYIARVAAPGGSVVSSAGFSSTTSRSAAAGATVSYEGFFVPASSDPARVNLKVATAHSPVGFDNVSVKPVLGYSMSSLAEYVMVVHAENDSALTVSCATLGWPAGCAAADLKGNVVALPTVVPAGSSVFLVRRNSPWLN